ncbi:hypothetical protein RCC89_18945 [Cytophagaceae bacterium ABcell3]|nr:hypothetical protein RCC89_18945 [Cytophagaceae bacterium ABcell3]
MRKLVCGVLLIAGGLSFSASDARVADVYSYHTSEKVEVDPGDRQKRKAERNKRKLERKEQRLLRKHKRKAKRLKKKNKRKYFRGRKKEVKRNTSRFGPSPFKSKKEYNI